MRTTSAPPAIPDITAIQPVCRPITSTTITRLCDSAVVCSRSIASVQIETAVSKPKVTSVAERSLSIVFGTPTTGKLMVGEESRRDAERVLAADRDEGVEALAAEVAEHLLDPAVLLVGVRARGADDRAAAREEAGDLAPAERLEPALDETPPAFAHRDDLPARLRATAA